MTLAERHACPACGRPWRDEERLSARHKTWGHDYPANDIDFLLAEYDLHRVMGLVDYKQRERSGRPYIDQHARAVLIDLADRPCVQCGGLLSCRPCSERMGYEVIRRIPVFVTAYAEDFSWWEPYALNELAEAHTRDGNRMTEAEYKRFILGLRLRRRVA